MRSDHVWLSDASRHAPKVVYELVRPQTGLPAEAIWMFFFSFCRFGRTGSTQQDRSQKRPFRLTVTWFERTLST
jgi:hypothetical protein